MQKVPRFSSYLITTYMIDSITWLYSLIAVIVVSLVAFIGIVTFSVALERLKKGLLFLVSFAAGAMIGDVFIHLLPEILEESENHLEISIWILVGIILFLLLEKIIFWRHCHELTTENHPHSFGTMNLIGDALHNLLDGVIIAGSFMVSPFIGVTTTIAVLLHEIPQEIGDFGVLLHAGYSRAKALLFNFFSALTSVLGAVIMLIVGDSIEHITYILIPITVGGFMYIALSDLLPQIHEEAHTKRSTAQFMIFIFGIAVMSLLLLFE